LTEDATGVSNSLFIEKKNFSLARINI